MVTRSSLSSDARHPPVAIGPERAVATGSVRAVTTHGRTQYRAGATDAAPGRRTDRTTPVAAAVVRFVTSHDRVVDH
ncbi:hypothetical protein [Rhodococcus sp. RDE2]|uniref:hypothetical protein n=1 Tax=Rhodococcus sp. RDE2 TaxID=2885078 RepID=UPI001E63A929|nr:hypothetical protein [Rhodococcus sp. RDE2]BDB61358.1 hypothetical protein RDE2_31520 [Rhodococcus sp. RDE2]